MNRRDFLWSASAASATLALANPVRLFAEGAAPGTWRTFEVTTRVEVLKSAGITRIWYPVHSSIPRPSKDSLEQIRRRGRHRKTP